MPVAYWVNGSVYRSFVVQPNLGRLCEIVSGMTTGNNEIYLRLWHEISNQDFALNCTRCDNAAIQKHKWYPYNKGGNFRRWYGNNEYVVNWLRHDEFNRAKTTMTHLYLKRCLTWGDITSAFFSARACDEGFFFDVKGSCAFPNTYEYYGLLGLFNSRVAYEYIKIINPTITTQVGDLQRIPYYNEIFSDEIERKCRENVSISRSDWDYIETSWDFQRHPLI